MNDTYAAKEITAALLDILKTQGLRLKEALRLIKKTEKIAESTYVSMVITAVDRGGNMAAMHRIGDSLLASISISHSKAYMTAALHAPTEDVARDILPGQPLYGLQQTHSGGFCTFGGKLPITKHGDLTGGLEVSGDTMEQDIAVARYALSAN